MDLTLFRRNRRLTIPSPRPPARRETIRPGKAAVAVELTRGGPAITDKEAEEAVERWLNPEAVSRVIITRALWEMEQHWWAGSDTDLNRCVCGWAHVSGSLSESMRRHKENRLAEMLGLSIRKDAK